MSLPKITLPPKPQYIKLADDLDFFELFKKIEEKYATCFLFESLGRDDYDSRLSIIGFQPEHQVRAYDDTLYFDDVSYTVSNPFYALRDILPAQLLSKNYAGGLVGNLNYEAVNYFEPKLNLQEHPSFPNFSFGVYTDGLVYDKTTGQTFYFYYENNRLEDVKVLLSQTNIRNTQVKAEFLGYNISKEEHEQGVLEIIEEIKAGNTFQCEFGLRANYKIQGEVIQIYERLREINPSPYMFYLKNKEKVLLGASPELLFRLRDGEIETFPLAGTAGRGGDSKEDKQLARKLLNDSKEIAEHNMLVDLHRNDLGRVAKLGTVKIRKLMDIVKFSHVQHISSEITGTLDYQEDMFSGLASIFPGGVVSGAPKLESMKIINRQEFSPRGPYAGAVGHFGFNGNCTFCIPLRSLYVDGQEAYAQACSGIVYDSVPENEYQEVINKLAGMEKATHPVN